MVKRKQHIGMFLHNEMGVSWGGMSLMCGRSSIHPQKIFFLRSIDNLPASCCNEKLSETCNPLMVSLRATLTCSYLAPFYLTSAQPQAHAPPHAPDPCRSWWSAFVTKWSESGQDLQVPIWHIRSTIYGQGGECGR